MKKLFIVLIFVTSALYGCSYDIFNKDESGASDFYKNYKKEKIEKCLSYEQAKENPELVDQYGCVGGGSDLFSDETVNLAIDYAKQIKYIFKTKDIKTLSQIVSYPVYIHNYPGKDKDIIINSEEELLKLDKNILFPKSTYKAIDENKLFWNWRGFMLGNGEVWFWADDKESKISNLTFNITKDNS